MHGELRLVRRQLLFGWRRFPPASGDLFMRAFIVAIALVTGLAAAGHAEDKDKKPAGTAKGAAVGALAGHEVGSGHAVAGAATGAAIGHHQQAKAEKNKDKESEK
jgi:uncharacterized protein YcfJ